MRKLGALYTKIMFFLAMVVQGIGSFSQTHSFQSYDGIYSRGNIPEDMRKTVKELYDEDRGRMEQYTDRRKSRRSKGVLECSYAINKMVQGGRILYGDPITQWINQVADTLLKNDPRLRNELRFYTYKSHAVNAFATGQGMIFVSTGLVSRLQNEAQLAYILSHEIVHYVNNHTWETISAKAEEGSRRNTDLDKMINKHNRSHRMEVEADSLGLILYYLPSNYYSKVADEVMDILLRSDYAAHNIPFDTAYFNTQYYKLPADIWLKTVAALDMNEYKADSASTHPNIGKRRSLAYRITASQPERGEKQLCINEQDFEQIRYLAQMETIRQLVIGGGYVRAFYDSWCLQKKYPDNTFLSKVMAYSLYAMAKYKTVTNTNDMIGNYNNMGGEIQQLYHCFGKMKSADINVLAVRELYKYRQKYGVDDDLGTITSDAVQLLVNGNKLELKSFLRQVPLQQKSKQDTTAKKLTKYERLKRGSKVSADVADMRTLAFVDCFAQGNEFEIMFNQALNDTVCYSNKNNKILVLSPSYRCYESDGDMDIKESDQKESKFIETIANTFRYSEKEAVSYSGHLLKESTSDTFYNQYMSLNEWLREIDTDVPIVLISQNDAEKVFTAYGIDQVAIMGVQAVSWSGLGGFLLPLPYTFYKRVANRCDTRLGAIMVNTRGVPLKSYWHEYSRNDEQGVINQHVYNSVTDIKNPGYLGKHFVVSAMVDPFINVSLSDDIESVIGGLVGLEYGLKMETIISKKLSVVAEASNYKLNNINFLNMQLALRNYMRNSLAPLGEYLQMGVNTILTDFENLENQKNSASLAVSLNVGRTYVLYDALQLDIYYGVSYPLIKQYGFSSMPHNYLRLGISIGFIPF